MCFSDTESCSDSDGEELYLNFMALIAEEEQKRDPDTETIIEDDADDLNHDLEAEYK